jgi:protein-S-isoprenylcysteine O-methyltransferase Ste14
MTLAVRAIGQMVAFVAVIGLLLFLPAGTLRWFEAWGFIAAFVGPSVAITLWLYVADRALLERRMAMGDRGEPDPKQKRIQSFMGLASVAMMITCGLDHRFGWTYVPRAIALAADALVVVSFAIIFFVFRANTFTSSVVEVTEKQTVVTTGPYRFVRHPMYSGALLLLAATPIALGSLAAEAWVPIFYVGVVLRLLDEERILKRELSGYEEYTHKTRDRLIPHVW